MKLNEKQSLPRLSTTNIPLFEKPRNVPVPKPVIPDRTSSLFEEQVYDENVGPNIQSEPKPKLLLRKSVEDPAMAKVKKLYYDDAFATRGAHNSPKDRITFESVVVVELKTNMQVRTPSIGLALPFLGLTRTSSLTFVCPRHLRNSPTPSRRSISDQRHRCW